MPPATPAPLLRLRESDIVRLCGLLGAARGLELAAQGGVSHPRRIGATLRARVRAAEALAPGEGCAAWVAVPAGEETPLVSDAKGQVSLRFGCSCVEANEVPTAAGADARACAHVAALLALWIRHPADFVVPDSGVSHPAAREANAAEGPQATVVMGQRSVDAPVRALPGRAAPEGPAVLRPSGAPTTLPPLLADELERLATPDLEVLARRVVGEEPLAEWSRADEAATPDPARVRATLLAALATTLRDPILVEALIARLDPLAAHLLTIVVMRGGSLTTSDLDGIALRMGRAASGLHAAAEVLERHGLLYHISGRPGDQAGSRGWRDLSGWRIPADLAALAVTTLPLPSAATPHGLLSAEHDDEAPRYQAPLRMQASSPRALIMALVLLAHAPPPLGPFGVSGPTRDGDAEAAEPPALAVDASERARSTRRGAPTRAGRTFPLVAGDLGAARLGELARVAGMEAGIARLARRLLLWTRAAPSAAALLELDRLALTAPEAWLDAVVAGFLLWARAEGATELADLDLCAPPLRLGIDLAHPAFRPAALAADARRGRTLALRLMALARVGVWYRVDDLLDLLWQGYPTFLRGSERLHLTPPWWLERAATGQRLRVAVAAEWRAAEGAYLRMLLAGPLRWWGIVDLAIAESAARGDAERRAERGTEPHGVAFRVTPLGAYLLAASATHPTSAPSEAISTGIDAAASALRLALAGDWGAPYLVTRTREIAVQPLAAGPAVLAALDLWAEPRGVVAGRLIYAPSPARACLAFDRGLAPTSLLAPLRAVAEAPGVHALAEQLDAWYARYGTSRISREMVLLEAADEASLVEALAYIPTVAARVRRLAPNLALIPADALDEVRERFARRGYHL